MTTSLTSPEQLESTDQRKTVERPFGGSPGGGQLTGSPGGGQLTDSRLERREIVLLEKINRGLPPESERRFRQLIAARQDGVIRPEELDELITLTDEAETLQVERLEHLAELARIRGKDLLTVMNDLGIEPRPVE